MLSLSYIFLIIYYLDLTVIECINAIFQFNLRLKTYLCPLI